MEVGLAMAEQRTDPSDLSWHVGFCVNESDARSLKCLNNAKYETYYPQIREMRPTPKRRLTARQRQSPIRVMEPVLVPFWPRYFFIRFSLLDGQWHDLFEMAHIRGLICDDRGGKLVPAPVSDAVIQGILSMETNGAIPAVVTLRMLAYSIGEKVRISSGVFMGHNAVVHELPDTAIEELDEAVRVRLLVSLFGRSSVVELALSDIEKL